jgi:hypothetical protein
MKIENDNILCAATIVDSVIYDGKKNPKPAKLIIGISKTSASNILARLKSRMDWMDVACLVEDTHMTLATRAANIPPILQGANQPSNTAQLERPRGSLRSAFSRLRSSFSRRPSVETYGPATPALSTAGVGASGLQQPAQ